MKASAPPIANWLATLPSLRSSADYDLAIAGLEKDIAAAERRDVELGQALDTSIFEAATSLPRGAS